MSKTTQAVILAGGLGTRLRPLTDHLPKPMVEVCGKPFLEHQLLLLRKRGMKRVLLLTGYLGDMIEDYFGAGANFGMDISYSREARALGTGGALRNAVVKLEDTFLLLNGDTLLDIDYLKLVRRFGELETTGLIVAWPNCDAKLVSNISLDSDGRVLAYSKSGGEGLFFVDAGVAAYRRSVLDLIPAGEAVSLETDVLPKLIENKMLFGYRCTEPFYDMGSPGGIERLRRFLE